MSVNDGGGLYDNLGLIDSLVVDCNTLVKDMAAGEYVQFCCVIVQMVQKLGNLKEGVAADLKTREDTITELKAALGVEVAKTDV